VNEHSFIDIVGWLVGWLVLKMVVTKTDDGDDGGRW